MDRHYTADHTMRSLIAQDASILMVLSRFNISLGFGDSTVNEVCRKHNVDTTTFLTVANFISFDELPTEGTTVDFKSLLVYLRGAHDYIVDFFMPMIRRKLTEAITVTGGDDLSYLILKYFDEYAAIVSSHMRHEDTTVFTHIEQLLDGVRGNGNPVELMSKHHDSLSTNLTSLKDLIIRYYPHKNSAYLNSALYDLIVCERDILSHCRVEDLILSPAVRRLEQSLPEKATEHDNQEQDSRLQLLTERERDVLKCVARGLANKEIADRLCLSIHTVTTHRRNIASKLDIHSPSALTIFAILNNLISIDEIHTP